MSAAGGLDELRRLLERSFEPQGCRLGILMLDDASAEEVELAAAALEAHGLSPARRLARLMPPPGRKRHRDEEVADFLRRYGHEYVLAWLPDAELEDRTSIEAAARESGCALGWRR